MTALPTTSPPPSGYGTEKATVLALRLAHAEKMLLTFTGGQVDAIVDPEGGTYLLRPAQEHLRENEKRLRSVLDSAADMITVVNRGGAILSQSSAAGRLLGYAADELVGRSLFEFIHEEDVAAVYSAFFHVIEGFHENATMQFRHRASDESWRMIEATVGTWLDDSGTKVVLTCRAITPNPAAHEEAARLEAALAEASRVKDRLLAMLSHELRTPLTPALLGVQALEEDARFTAARPTLAMIRRNIDLQARLLENLLDFTRILHGKLQTKHESIDAHAAVRNVLEICQSDIAAGGIDVQLGLPAPENHVRADATELQQILWNLVRNAVKFSPPGGRLDVTFDNDGEGHLFVAVTDHGIGIEPALLPRVFDSFQQGDRSVQQRYGGLGLGLFIAKTLAEAQDGTLAVASEGRGKGATFLLTLCTTEAPASPSVPPLSPPARSVRILLVEDHADTRATLARLLERRGHHVSPAADIASALLLAESGDFELLISDLGLPDGTGHELMAQLRLTRPSLQGIALSGFGLPSDIDQSREAGFAEHLVKPITVEAVEAAMRAVVAGQLETASMRPA